MTITLNHKQPFKIESGSLIKQVLKDKIPSLYSKAIAAKVNDRLVDLNTPLDEDANVSVLTFEDDAGRDIFWHSSSHLMAQAVKALYPDAQLGIGPSISNGFYYDFKLDTPITVDDLPRIEAKMKEIVLDEQSFTHSYLKKEEALRFFESRNEPFKVELIDNLEDQDISIYQNGSFSDLCRGPHIDNTKFIKHFKLLSVAGAYWHGDEKNAVMQRIYGVSFPKAKDLEDHLFQLEEAKKRDHRKLGKELDLFSFQEEGPGFPFWHPNGCILRRNIMHFMTETLGRYGYQEIITPIILSEKLWHQSGHWDHYQENMYFTTIDEEPYAVKPMNCPGGLLVYKNRPYSYRDLPLKIAEMGMVHRHEKSGVLHGLFRVRMFTQDDAHVYCTPEQLEDEIIHIIDLIHEVYTVFGFDQYQLELSTRPEKSIGSAEMWAKAESALQNALETKGLPFQINEGDGAFYGPKIDYHIQDSLGRTWQCGTIQVDFSMPERFGLEYTGPDGEKHRPVMIHRAVLGSLERFMGILIEHYGGAFPLWLAPVQCIIIPISEKHHAYAKDIRQKMQAARIRVELDDRNEKMGYKIREAETKKINYMCIVGDKEAENGSVSLRKRKEGDIGSLLINDVIDNLLDEINRRTNN